MFTQTYRRTGLLKLIAHAVHVLSRPAIVKLALRTNQIRALLLVRIQSNDEKIVTWCECGRACRVGGRHTGFCVGSPTALGSIIHRSPSSVESSLMFSMAACTISEGSGSRSLSTRGPSCAGPDSHSVDGVM